MSSFLHVIRMPMLTVSFLSQLYSGILYLENVFLCPKIQMDLSLELADNFYLQVLSKRLSCILFIFLLLFPVTMWLVVTVQPCMEKTSLKICRDIWIRTVNWHILLLIGQMLIKQFLYCFSYIMFLKKLLHPNLQ